MKKNIYDILNETKIDLDEYDKKDFTDIEKRKIKNNFKKSIKSKHKYKKAASIAVAVALSVALLGTSFGGYAYAGVNSFIYDIGSFLGIQRNLDEYKTVVNKSVTKDGISIKLNEVVLDNDELIVSTVVTNSEKIKEGACVINSDIYINGKRMNVAAGGSAQKLDDYTTEQVLSHDLDSGDLNGDLNIKIVYSDALINEKEKKGPWIFEFKTNGDELAAATKEILLNNTFTIQNGQKITLEKYTSNNLGQKIYYSKSPKGTLYDMVLRGNDDLGNEIEFCASREDAKKGMFKLCNIDGNLNKNAKVLKLTPYAVKLPEESGRLSNDFKKVGKQFTIDLTKLHK